MRKRISKYIGANFLFLKIALDFQFYRKRKKCKIALFGKRIFRQSRICEQFIIRINAKKRYEEITRNTSYFMENN